MRSRYYFITALLLVFCALLAGCDSNNSVTETKQESVDKGDEDSAKKIEKTVEEQPKTKVKTHNITTISMMEAFKAIEVTGKMDDIVFLGEECSFNLPLIDENDSEDIYNRTKYTPFELSIEGEQLRELESGTYVIDEPIQGVREITLKYEDGTEKTIRVLFIYSFEFAAIPDYSSVTEVDETMGIYDYYRYPMIAMSEKYKIEMEAWKLLLNDALGEQMTIWKSIRETGSKGAFANLDYEITGSDEAISLVFVARSGVANTLEDRTRVFSRHIGKEGFAPLTNTELLEKFQLQEEGIKKLIEKRLAEKSEIEIQGVQYELIPPGDFSLDDTCMFVKNGDLYLSLPYGRDSQIFGYIPVNLGSIR